MSYGKYTKQFELYYWDNSSNRQYINLPIYSLFIGTFIGEKVNPTLHHYECTCDCPPVLTEFQALILATTYMILLSIVLYYFLRSLDLSRCKRRIWWIVLFLLNGTSCFIAMNILSTEVSG